MSDSPTGEYIRLFGPPPVAVQEALETVDRSDEEIDLFIM